jgi:glycosyltransferase involved in cell wall biosynthesis
MTTAVPVPTLHIPGDPQHGVTVYASRLAAQIGSTDRHPGDLHLHFTDRLFGADPARAAAAVEGMARHHRLTVTLHDLPQPSDGEHGLARRADCYRRVVRASEGVVCNSEHEARLLRRFVDDRAEPTVIPLPVEPPSAGAPVRIPAAPGVSILGFLYPGKGHEPAIRAAALLADSHPGIRVEALGRASTGHEADAAQLAELAAGLGVGFELTGYLSDAAMHERCRSAGVPLIAHEHVSASGSLASWLEAGRRPVVVRSPYMVEMAALHRGAVTLVDAADLVDAIAAALAHPESTWLDGTERWGPDLALTAEAYRRFWAEALR